MSDIRLPHHHHDSSRDYLEKIPETEDFQAVSEVFSMLGDTTRVRLFWVLCHCEECVINLSAMLGMSSPALSHHLKLLKTSGLVVNRREGREMFYRAADTELAQELHRIIEKVLKITCPG